MESIKSFFRKKHKYQDEFMSQNEYRNSLHSSFRGKAPPMKSPYSVVTEPKTKKAPRSCPGGRMDYQPTISNNTMSNNTMYENLANNDRRKLYAQQMLAHKGFDERDEIQHRVLMQNGSSEYGSQDPSPTNPFSRKDQSFDSSDSEGEGVVEAFYRNLYEKNIRKLERKYRKADHAAKKIEQAYYSLHIAHNELRKENSGLKHLLNGYKNENNVLKERIHELEQASQQNAMNHENIVYGGAPEAMCSISELGRDAITSYPHASRPSQPYRNHETALFVEGDENDEVKIFENNDEFELPRSVSNSINNPCSLSPETRALSTIKLELDENPYLLLSTEHTVSQGVNKHSNQIVHFDTLNNSSDEERSTIKSEHLQQPSQINQIPQFRQTGQTSEAKMHENTIFYVNPPIQVQIKRSFSDSDLRDLSLSINENVDENVSNKQKNRMKRASTRYSKNDHSSSYSSDDDRIKDAIDVQTRQLKPKGEVVHYRPPRRSILNKGTNVYRRCGPNERKVIAEFDYLNDISTNSSGLD